MQISDYELELMKIIWGLGGEAMYSDIVEGLEKQQLIWTKNTIITLLSRLVEKKMLSTNKVGRRNRYRALIAEVEYQKNQTLSFLDKVYAGNPKGLVATLMETKLLTESDYNELRKFWEGGMKDD